MRSSTLQIPPLSVQLEHSLSFTLLRLTLPCPSLVRTHLHPLWACVHLPLEVLFWRSTFRGEMVAWRPLSFLSSTLSAVCKSTFPPSSPPYLFSDFFFSVHLLLRVCFSPSFFFALFLRPLLFLNCPATWKEGVSILLDFTSHLILKRLHGRLDDV